MVVGVRGAPDDGVGVGGCRGDGGGWWWWWWLVVAPVGGVAVLGGGGWLWQRLVGWRC